MNRICCIYNSGAHYRWPIFKALADNFDIDFCFGPNTVYTKSIKTFDYQQLPGFTRLLVNRRLPGKFYWQSGAVRQAFRPYRQYVILGEAYCLSSWVVALCLGLTFVSVAFDSSKFTRPTDPAYFLAAGLIGLAC